MDVTQKITQTWVRLRNVHSRFTLMALLMGSVLIGAIFSYTNSETEPRMASPSQVYAQVRNDQCPVLVPTTKSLYNNLDPLLTLFTTFKRKQDRWRIHLNVLRNWSLLQPRVRMVLFDDRTDKSLIFFARQHNWTILPVPSHSVYGTPILKDMYFRCRKEFPRSLYFGYANGDILFDIGLANTVERVTSYLDQLNRTLIVGKRTNFKVNSRRIMTLQEVRALAEAEGTLFRSDAVDYFLLAHNSFPWEHVPNVVIGRPGYDNFLVATAGYYDVSVIDATQTIVALHQTGKDGNFAGQRNIDVEYNTRLIGPFNYQDGLTTSAQYVTRYDRWGCIEVWRKPRSGSEALLLTPAMPYTLPSRNSHITYAEALTMATPIKRLANHNETFKDRKLIFVSSSSNQTRKLMKNVTMSSMYNHWHLKDPMKGYVPLVSRLSRGKQKKMNISQDQKYTQSNHTKPRNRPIRDLVTVFTVFDARFPLLRFMHLNVLRSWSQYKPSINTVLFSDKADSIITNLAKKLNWTILPAILQRGSVPPIKKMFLKVQEVFPESLFYGYIKGDLLCTNDLLKTVHVVQKGLEEASNALIVGMKYKATIQEGKMIYETKDIQKVIKSEDTMLLSQYDETFLFAHRTFPWMHIPELVIGRTVYNNYIVAQALRHEFPVVDATKTLQCLEQVSPDPSLIQNELDDFDPNLLGTLDYSKGFAIHAQFETVLNNVTNIIELQKRQRRSKS